MKLGQLDQKHTDTMVISKVSLFSFIEREEAKKEKQHTHKLQQ
jgi:hypothetical protein